jgi:hypothetical protein
MKSKLVRAGSVSYQILFCRQFNCALELSKCRPGFQRKVHRFMAAFRLRRQKRTHHETRSVLRFICIFTLLCIVQGCISEKSTKVSVDGNVPPTFSFVAGTGAQMELKVSEVPPENREIYPFHNTEKDIVLWRIVPDRAMLDKARPWPRIIYGQIPEGFTQTVPDKGEPPPLIEGRIYWAGGLASAAPGGIVFFTIRDSKSVEVPLTSLDVLSGVRLSETHNASGMR